jgi:hypothetical protein
MNETCVNTLDPVTGETIDHCNGPTRGGSCPYTDRDGIVPCNGCRIAAMGAGPEYWLMYVPPASRHCPRAWNLEALGY